MINVITQYIVTRLQMQQLDIGVAGLDNYYNQFTDHKNNCYVEKEGKSVLGS